MQPLFGSILDSYALAQRPAEPHASDLIARPSVYWLKVTACDIRRKKGRFHARIRLVMFNEDLDPPFEAVYERDRKLDYPELCEELAKLQVFLHHPDALGDSCRSAIGVVWRAACMPGTVPDWMRQTAR